MAFEGGCYCGQVRYEAEGKPQLKAQCHCRACQTMSGGAPNLFMLMPPEGFRYLKGAPKTYARSDLAAPVTREFCANCGTHLTTRRPGLPFVILKIGTLDNPSSYGRPTDGDPYPGQAAVPRHSGRHAGVRARTAALSEPI
jgi:hypothetical protein